jgi:hypothetical protein
MADTPRDGKHRRLTAHDAADVLQAHRDNDLMVRVNGTYVPVVGVHYHGGGDFMVIRLEDGEELKIALLPERPEGSDEE